MPRGNKEAKGKSGTHEMSPIVRRSFQGALARIANGEGAERALVDLIERSLKDDFVATMTMLAKFEVKEARISGVIDHEHNHSHRAIPLSETDRLFIEITQSGENRPH